MVPAVGAVSINAESRHLVCELLDTPRKFGIVLWLCDVGECWQVPTKIFTDLLLVTLLLAELAN
jgi:hypothetical protein